MVGLRHDRFATVSQYIQTRLHNEMMWKIREKDHIVKDSYGGGSLQQQSYFQQKPVFRNSVSTLP
jgi:hypothetical protein